MIREDGKIVIQRRFNYRLKTIILRDYEIEEIHNFYENKIKNKNKERDYNGDAN